MNRITLGGLYRSPLVDRLTDHVDDAAQCGVPDRNSDSLTRVGDILTALESIGDIHRDAADGVLTEVLRNLGSLVAVALLAHGTHTFVVYAALYWSFTRKNIRTFYLGLTPACPRRSL